MKCLTPRVLRVGHRCSATGPLVNARRRLATTPEWVQE